MKIQKSVLYRYCTYTSVSSRRLEWRRYLHKIKWATKEDELPLAQASSVEQPSHEHSMHLYDMGYQPLPYHYGYTQCTYMMGYQPLPYPYGYTRLTLSRLTTLQPQSLFDLDKFPSLITLTHGILTKFLHVSDLGMLSEGRNMQGKKITR